MDHPVNVANFQFLIMGVHSYVPSFLSFSGDISSKFLMGAMESGMEASDCFRWFRRILASGSGSAGITASCNER